MALGKGSGHKVVRINLSEQTDMMDLLGSDLPVTEGGQVTTSYCTIFILNTKFIAFL